LFLNGKAACYIEGRSVTTDLRQKATFDWDIAPIPAYTTNQNCNGWSGSVGYAVYKNCAHPDEAFDLAKYFTSKEGQLIMAEAGFTAPLYNDDETMAAFYKLEEGKLPANTGEFIRAATYQRAGLWQYLPSVRWKTTFDEDTGAMFTADPSLRQTPEQFLPDESNRILSIIQDDFPELFTSNEGESS
jgi:multiple sugar transport system substrate-binding protein